MEEGVERLRSGQGGKIVLISWIKLVDWVRFLLLGAEKVCNRNKVIYKDDRVYHNFRSE